MMVNLTTEPRVAPPAEVLRGRSEKVATVGLSGVSAGSGNIDEFWRNVPQGTSFR